MYVTNRTEGEKGHTTSCAPSMLTVLIGDSDAMVTHINVPCPDLRSTSSGPLTSRVLKPGKRISNALLCGFWSGGDGMLSH